MGLCVCLCQRERGTMLLKGLMSEICEWACVCLCQGERGTMLLKGPMSEMRAAMDFTKRFGRKTGRRWADREKDETTDTEVHEEDDFLPRKFANIDVVDFADKMVGVTVDSCLNYFSNMFKVIPDHPPLVQLFS